MFLVKQEEPKPLSLAILEQTTTGVVKRNR
jgi:hypothetical protein